MSPVLILFHRRTYSVSACSGTKITITRFYSTRTVIRPLPESIGKLNDLNLSLHTFGQKNQISLFFLGPLGEIGIETTSLGYPSVLQGWMIE